MGMKTRSSPGQRTVAEWVHTTFRKGRRIKQYKARSDAGEPGRNTTETASAKGEQLQCLHKAENKGQEEKKERRSQ